MVRAEQMWSSLLPATVPDAPSVVAGAVDREFSVSPVSPTGPSNRDTDRVDVDVAVVDPRSA